MELLYAQGMLNNARGLGRGPEIQNPALTELLQKLRDMAYRAEDVLDELEYFRIQDELNGTYYTSDKHGSGWLCNQVLHAHSIARNIRNKMLGFSSDDETDEDTTSGVPCGAWACRLAPKTPDDDEQEADASQTVLCQPLWPCGMVSSKSKPPTPLTNKKDEEVASGCMGRLTSGAIHTLGKHFTCLSDSRADQDAARFNSDSTGNRSLSSAHPNKIPHKENIAQEPKLKFDRIEMSQKMKEIVEQLKPLVSTILSLELLDSSRSIIRCIGTSLDTLLANGRWPTHRNAMTIQSKTNPEFTEPELYGRDQEKSGMINNITGKYCEKDLTILPIVGPGGIGKTALAQYIYKEIKNHFDVKLWVCVSVNFFSVSRLTQEVEDELKKYTEDKNDKRIDEHLNSKKFLLVLDDMWNCSNVSEWNSFLVPFRKGQTKGSVILVTTRFPALAQMVKTTEGMIYLEGLKTNAFKNLFLAYVFGDKQSANDHSELLGIGDKIVEKLKGSPLAAKTVARLLRNNLDLSHWAGVLESKEWESQSGEHDIMPALKLSFDYLPFHLQQCFTYCALFPEDYKFGSEELIHFWIGLDVILSHSQNKSIKDVGQSYLTELVDHGFFKGEKDEHAHTYYIIHDLLHELATKVSKDECLSIDSSNNVRSLQIPPSIRHLSINIDESSVKDRETFNDCKEGFMVLKKRLNVENLHSLMLFGEYQRSFVKTFRSLLRKAKALRVIFISGCIYRVEDLFHSFSDLVHLRYLRIEGNGWEESEAPKDISRFYHLRVLDLQGCNGCYGLPRHMSNLLKLRHFLVPNDGMHASIFEVGKLKLLQELRRFVVRKKNNDGKKTEGFELRQLGHLLELCGSLSIGNLENIEGREEADGAKLMHKKHLHELILEWSDERSNKDAALEDQVLEGLKPHSNLRKLSIIGHGGTTCPSWLGGLNLSVKNLESLCLDGVAWEMLPPIGELRLVNEGHEKIPSNIPDQYFECLKRIKLKKLARLKRWVLGGSGPLLPNLEALIIKDCPELVELPFSNSIWSQQEQKTRFCKLQVLKIKNCPKLSSLPPVPLTRSMCSVEISGVGSGFGSLSYGTGYYEKEMSLRISGENGNDQDTVSFWTTAMDFGNLTEVKMLEVENCPPMPLDDLKKLSSSLKVLVITDMRNVLWAAEDGSHDVVRCEFPVLERMKITGFCGSGKELTQVLCCMPKLSALTIFGCEKITGLGVVEQRREAASSPSEVEAHRGQHKERGEQQIADEEEGFLLLPPQLQKLDIFDCKELSLRLGLILQNEKGEISARGGPCSLRSLSIWGPPSSVVVLRSSSGCSPFPTSLQSLHLGSVDKLPPLSNLASLTALHLHTCRDAGGAGLGDLLAHGCLRKLSVQGSPNFFSQMLQQEGFSAPWGKLESLRTDDVAGVLAKPICGLLSSSLTDLIVEQDKQTEGFTGEQDEALELLTSLQQLRFFLCDKLRRLPAGLHKLTNLETLRIEGCDAIRSLPKGGLPNSLRELRIFHCKSFKALPKDGLPNSLRELKISRCKSFKALPKDGLPNSLRELMISGSPSFKALPEGGLPSSLQILDVQSSSEELRRQCRKLIGTIPIVRA